MAPKPPVEDRMWFGEKPRSPPRPSPSPTSPPLPRREPLPSYPAAPEPMSLIVYDPGVDIARTYGGTQTSLGPIPARPKGYNDSGKAVDIELNSYVLDKIPDRTVWQYDVDIGNGVEKRLFMKFLWECDPVRKVRVKKGEFDDWIWDGNKLAWSTRKLDTVTIDVDTAVVRGQPSAEKPDIKHVRIKRTKKVDFTILHAWLGGQTTWDVQLIECLTFLDHLMREGPSRRLVSVKRSFFPPYVNPRRDNEEVPNRRPLGEGVEAVKGVYASIRPVHTAHLKANLAVNIDVANACFFQPVQVMDLLGHLIGVHDADSGLISKAFRDATSHRDGWHSSAFYVATRRLHKTWVTVGDPPNRHRYMIKTFIPDATRNIRFMREGQEISVYNYWKIKYPHEAPPLNQMPVIRTTRGQYIPIDKAWMESNQRCMYRLDEFQTAKMLNFASTLPAERFDSIKLGIKNLGWQEDQHLKHYGLHIAAQPTLTRGRVLNPPDIHFGRGSLVPGKVAATGRWRIDGKQFYKPYPRAFPYCVLIIDRPSPKRAATDLDDLKAFFGDMSKIAKAHGMQMAPAPAAYIHSIPESDGATARTMWAKAISALHGQCPKVVFVILHSRSAEHYRAVKRQCDIEFGVASQCMQSSHVKGRHAQYISNVLLKVNAKLGGTNSLAKKEGGFLERSQFDLYRPEKSIKKGHSLKKLMIIGADVSHGAPGTQEESLASITVSKELDCCNYMGWVNTNGHREEMIRVSNWNKMFYDLIETWMKNNGGPPNQLIYIRDGVSERQYSHVLEIEVNEIKRLFKQKLPKVQVPITVLIASKRHHVRFNPVSKAARDPRGNPVPGVLVETGVTHPYEFDWYMNPHSAIKGTCRPIHYHCIFNENQFTGPEMQQLIFEHSFQYARSTTPVSLFPAVYYAHLAAKRAEAHIRKELPRTEEEQKREKARKKEEKRLKKEQKAKEAEEAERAKGSSSGKKEKPSTEKSRDKSPRPKEDKKSRDKSRSPPKDDRKSRDKSRSPDDKKSSKDKTPRNKKDSSLDKKSPKEKKKMKPIDAKLFKGDDDTDLNDFARANDPGFRHRAWYM